MYKFVTTKAVFDASGEMVNLRGYFYSGPIAMCGGPSDQQNELAAEQASFYKTMTTDYGKQFANQSAILDSLTKAWQPVMDAGINQYGFSPAEDAALRAKATDSTAANYSRAATGVNEQLAARGGTSFVPSGASAQMQQEVANMAASQESSQQLGITSEGYQTGRQDYMAASSALGGVAAQYNPVGMAGAANQSGTAAYNSAMQNQQMENQKWSQIGSMVGGAAMDIMAPGLSSAFSSVIGQ